MQPKDKIYVSIMFDFVNVGYILKFRSVNISLLHIISIACSRFRVDDHLISSLN